MSTINDTNSRRPEAETPQRTALDFNFTKGKKFLLNARGQYLHARTTLPEIADLKAVLFWYHGYAAHINGPTFMKFAEGMAADGYAVIAVDAHGHGYSDGETVLIRNYRHLVEDCMAIVDIVTGGKEDSEQCHLGMDAALRQKMASLPYFLCGQSLGGGVALLVALQLRSDAAKAEAAKRFVGVMVNCPAILGNPPPKPVVMLLKYVIAPLFPGMQLPSFLEKVSLPDLVWTSQESADMAALDKVGKPGGLGWPGTMRIGTGSQLLGMIAFLESKLPEVDFPFLVLHDPKDGIVRFEGTEKLMRVAVTPEGVTRGRELKEMLNMKHDLLSNAAQEMLESYIDWGGARLAALNGNPK